MQGESVSLEWSAKGTNKRCADVVGKSLAAKYGQPKAVASEVKVGDCGNSYAGGLAGTLASLCEGLGGENRVTQKYYRWVSEGVEITFKRDTSTEWRWSLEYRPAVKIFDEVITKL